MRACLALALVLLATPTASADAIRIPQCPDGWEGRRVGHGGYCFPVACSSDADCVGGRVCRPVGRCYRRQMRPAGRRPRDPDDPSSWFHQPDPDSECTDRCPGEQECRVASECLPPAGAAAEETPPADEPPPSPEPDAPAPAEPTAAPEDPATEAEAEDDSSGCAAGRDGSPLAWLGALAIAGLLRRR